LQLKYSHDEVNYRFYDSLLQAVLWFCVAIGHLDLEGGKKSTHNSLPLGGNVGLQGQDDAPRSTVVDVQRATMPSKPMQMQEKYF